MCVLSHLLICTVLRAHIIVVEALYEMELLLLLVNVCVCVQVASQVLGVPLSKIQVGETATSVIPNASHTAASVSSELFGGAVQVCFSD